MSMIGKAVLITGATSDRMDCAHQARLVAGPALGVWSEPLELDSFVVHTLHERSCKVERKKGERYSQEFRQQAVQRMKSCENIVRLSRELGMHRRLLYNWRDRSDETNPGPHRSREIILRKQITKLKGLLANKTMEVDFFRRALQRVDALRRQSSGSGARASIAK